MPPPVVLAGGAERDVLVAAAEGVLVPVAAEGVLVLVVVVIIAAAASASTAAAPAAIVGWHCVKGCAPAHATRAALWSSTALARAVIMRRCVQQAADGALRGKNGVRQPRKLAAM